MPPFAAPHFPAMHQAHHGEVTEEAFLRDFAAGVDPAKARVLYAVQGRIADTPFTSRTTAAAWKLKPSWYAVSKQDRAASPELERFFANRLRAKTIEVEAGHLSDHSPAGDYRPHPERRPP